MVELITFNDKIKVRFFAGKQVKVKINFGYNKKVSKFATMKQAYNISVSFLKAMPGKTFSLLSSLSPVSNRCRRCATVINPKKEYCADCEDRRRRREENPLSMLSEIHF